MEEEYNEDTHVGMENDDSETIKGIPHVGMQFSTAEEAYDFYNVYAARMGFAVRKSSTGKGKDGIITRRLYVCNKEGFKSSKDKREVGREVKRRKNEREGCEARMLIHRRDGGAWAIKFFEDNHCHDLLSTPKKVKLLRSHNKAHLEKSCKELVTKFYKCGFGPSKIAKILNQTSGDTNANITSQQCSSLLRKERKSSIGHEFMSVFKIPGIFCICDNTITSERLKSLHIFVVVSSNLCEPV